VLEVLDEQINPAIAAHGGRADLVAVEKPVAYLNLSGGCQGCGLAAVTLRQGIEAMILDAVPEITEVVEPPTTPAARTRTSKPSADAPGRGVQRSAGSPAAGFRTFTASQSTGNTRGSHITTGLPHPSIAP